MTKPVSEVVEELERLLKEDFTDRDHIGLVVIERGVNLAAATYIIDNLPTLLAEIKRGWEELREIAELTQRRQLPLTMQINDIARAALEGKDNG